MEKLRRRLPSLTGLVVFEAAARRLSFTSAAREMCITQAAVSRQVRQLEQHLGQALFLREHRSVSLTAAGQRLYEAVGQSLERVAQAVEDIGTGSYGSLTVSATIAFSTFWLMPRLEAFRSEYPQIGIRLMALDREVDLRGENIDVAFISGDEGQGPGVRMQRLFDEAMVPLCTPGFLRAPLNGPADLLDAPLLHLDREHWRYFSWPIVDWADWLEQAGYEGPLPRPRLSFNNYSQLIQAALDGKGIALGCAGMLQDYLADGRLIRPLTPEYRSARGYYLAFNERGANPAGVQLFADWWARAAPAGTA
ncbi:LysR family transcriptional regulator [Pseudomonas dryadis]|uniref:LysR family transcriptional regulator n=1 Tax=Phytopseudomonas dryadis TaxID=2487520 RepID=A0A4Q9QYA0_9GAMM|nr:LysR family transcriptional regulator [Pseudomonas dryadis]TBV04426.1 LysR family transcriptional regulator [Pseudomonas dryadis]TBV17152.1 LysR family transcriptional regulator [Pseudomonas sp. FRB 230]